MAKALVVKKPPKFIGRQIKNTWLPCLIAAVEIAIASGAASTVRHCLRCSERNVVTAALLVTWKRAVRNAVSALAGAVRQGSIGSRRTAIGVARPFEHIYVCARSAHAENVPTPSRRYGCFQRLRGRRRTIARVGERADFCDQLASMEGAATCFSVGFIKQERDQVRQVAL